MISGMTVYYRLSEENVNDVLFSRSLRATSVHEMGVEQPIIPAHHPILRGAPVEIGMMCPAEVFKPYSYYEHYKENGQEFPDGIEASKKSFSGFADLRVSLPGNDTLWVPRAEWDQYPTAAEVFFGVGTNVVPEVGKFTVVQPAPLLY